jgi:hypothetical protein
MSLRPKRINVEEVWDTLKGDIEVLYNKRSFPGLSAMSMYSRVYHLCKCSQPATQDPQADSAILMQMASIGVAEPEPYAETLFEHLGQLIAQNVERCRTVKELTG